MDQQRKHVKDEKRAADRKAAHELEQAEKQKKNKK